MTFTETLLSALQEVKRWDCKEGTDNVRRTPENTARFIRALNKAACDTGNISLSLFICASCEVVKLPEERR